MNKYLTSAVLLSLVMISANASAGSSYMDMQDSYQDTSYASDYESGNYDMDDSEWKFSLGAVGAYGDIGAIGIDTNKYRGMPILHAEHNNWTFSTLQGINYKFVNTPNWELKAGVSYDGGRRNSWLSKSRKGLGEIDEGAMAIASARYKWNGFNVSLKGSQSSADGDGALVSIGAGYAIPLTDSMRLGVKTETTWADDGYMQEYFGVSTSQSAATGLGTYEASNGIKNTSVSVDFTYSYDDNWAWKVIGGAHFLHEDAKNSPVPKNEVMPYAMTSVVYNF